MSVLIAGYPYIKENYFKTFDYYKDKVYFILPKIWKAKGGKIKFYPPPNRKNIFPTNAYFFHSHYPIIGGLLKGWMPFFPLILFHNREKIDIVYSPSEPVLLTTLYQGFWTKFFGKKHVIFTWENIDYEKKFRGFNLFLKNTILNLNLFFCDGVICGNSKAKEILSRYTDKLSESIPLSGVDSDFFKRENAPKRIKDLNLSDKLVFNFSGAIGYRKGLQVILKSFKKVLAELPNSHLLIVGSGEYEESLKSEVESLKLAEKTTLIPWANSEELRELFSISDVFLYPSISYEGWEEQFGYSMAEASLMELPVISTKTGSISEVVLDGKTGFLIEAENHEQLADAMINLGKNPELRREMGQAGQKYIEENFSYVKIAEKFYNFFLKL